MRTDNLKSQDLADHLPKTPRQRLIDRIGQMEVIIEQRPQLPPTSNGKLRAVVCKISSAALTAAVLGS